MEKLKNFEFRTTGPNSTYDWDTILDGSIYRLTAGEDFECKPKSFGMLARQQAKKRGGKVRVSEERGDDGEVTSIVLKYSEEA